jgi:hypothetical protein
MSPKENEPAEVIRVVKCMSNSPEGGVILEQVPFNRNAEPEGKGFCTHAKVGDGFHAARTVVQVNKRPAFLKLSLYTKAPEGWKPPESEKKDAIEL